MHDQRTIGIIGGMGPYAGLDLARKICDETIASSDQEHVPVALLSYPQWISDRTDYMLHGKGNDPAPVIFSIALELEKLGAVAAGIPCNSAHASPIFNRVLELLNTSGATLKVLHMIDEVIHHIKQQELPFNKIGILSTNGTFHLGVYSTALRKANIEFLLPTANVQESRVHPAIYHPVNGIKAQSNPISPWALEQITTVTEDFKRLGADALILGCTELPLAVPGDTFLGLKIIDPTRILARALIRETYPNKLKPR